MRGEGEQTRLRWNRHGLILSQGVFCSEVVVTLPPGCGSPEPFTDLRKIMSSHSVISVKQITPQAINACGVLIKRPLCPEGLADVTSGGKGNQL